LKSCVIDFALGLTLCVCQILSAITVEHVRLNWHWHTHEFKKKSGNVSHTPKASDGH